MVELVDSVDLGSSAKACRFESCRPHQTNIIRTWSTLWETGSDLLFLYCFFIQNELRGFLHSIRMAYMENYYPDDEDGEGDWAGEELCFLACQELRPLEKMFLNERRDLLLDASMDALPELERKYMILR